MPPGNRNIISKPNLNMFVRTGKVKGRSETPNQTGRSFYFCTGVSPRRRQSENTGEAKAEGAKTNTAPVAPTQEALGTRTEGDLDQGGPGPRSPVHHHGRDSKQQVIHLHIKAFHPPVAE